MSIPNYLGLSRDQITKIESDFMESISSGGLSKKPDLSSVIDMCSDEEKLLLRFLYAYMPASDVASYDPAFYLKHLRDTLEIRAKVPWGNDINGETFLNYVLPLRINNEDLTDHRYIFFNELYPRISELSVKEAVLEVNYWCFEKATYKSTDFRTLSPLGVIRSAYGRCGEESVLCVAALRSIGIPARQCYTPRWAHCDDNHAWVEVWINGRWYFIGACEPEPELNRGWFAEPASRGMLVHSKVFSKMVTEDEITDQSPVITEINILDNYAKTKILTVYVTDSGMPVKGADVYFELINYSHFAPIAHLTTNEQGLVSFKTGFGDLLVHIHYKDLFMYKKAETGCSELHFSMSDADFNDGGGFEYNQVPPAPMKTPSPTVTNEAAAKHKEHLRHAVAIRKNYESTFLQGEAAASYASRYESYQEELAALIASSNGNHKEITHFLDEDTNSIPLHYKVMLLRSLNPKDLSDITFAQLQGHLTEAYPFRGEFEDEAFQKYILCPRVHFEMITDYRGFINGYFNAEQKKYFIENPMRVYTYLKEHITDCANADYSTITASPSGLLELGYGSELSRKTLFVCICRTLGIPARISKIDKKLEYMNNSGWNIIDEPSGNLTKRTCHLILKNANKDIDLAYIRHFTISKLEDGVYCLLGLKDVTFENGTASFLLEEGQYRIVTSNRLHDGSIFADITNVRLENGKSQEISIRLRQPDDKKHSEIELSDIPVLTLNNENRTAQTLLPIGGSRVIAFLEVGKEPTEHLLNEIMEQRDEFKRLKEHILFVVKNPDCLKDKLLNKVIEEIEINTAYRKMDASALNELLSPLEMQDLKFPLLLGLNSSGKCVFHISGYNVGTGDLLVNYFIDPKQEDKFI